MIRNVLARDFILVFFCTIHFQLRLPMPHPHSPNLSFEVRFERSGDRGSRWHLFLLRIGLKALRWKSAFKISRKKVYARGGSPLCLGFPRLSLSSTLLASFDREGLSRNGVRILHTASYTLIANISPETHRGQSLSYFALSMSISGALGPSIGIFLINHFSFTLLFLTCSGLSFCSLFITSQIGEEAGRSTAGFPLG